jgi:hypothetical protein
VPRRCTKVKSTLVDRFSVVVKTQMRRGEAMGPEAGIARTRDTDTVSKNANLFVLQYISSPKAQPKVPCRMGSRERLEISSQHRCPASLLHDPSS